MPTAPSMAPLHYLAQDTWNEVQHDIFSHVKPLVSALASHDADGIINGTTAFLRIRQLKCGVTWLLWSCYTIGIGITNANSIINGKIEFLGQHNWNEVQQDFWSCDTTGISIRWWQWHHVTPMASSKVPLHSLAKTTEICPSHCTYMFHCIAIAIYIKPTLPYIYVLKCTKLQLLFTMVLQCMYQNIHTSQMSNMQINSYAYIRQLCIYVMLPDVLLESYWIRCSNSAYSSLWGGTILSQPWILPHPG